MYLPGTRIPIFAPDKIAATKPDYVMILPWNLREEIAESVELRPRLGGQICGANP